MQNKYSSEQQNSSIVQNHFHKQDLLRVAAVHCGSLHFYASVLRTLANHGEVLTAKIICFLLKDVL